MAQLTSSHSSSRRNFLKQTGTLIISFPLLSSCLTNAAEAEILAELPGSLRRFPNINSWLQVLADGRVRIYSGKVELGQGIRIAIKQVAAEELDMELDQVEIVLAETGLTPNEGYTAGSASIRNSAMAVRYAAAAARQKLLELASVKLKIAADKLHFSNGLIHTSDRKQQLSFAQILDGRQIEDEVKLPVPLKPKSEYRFVGKAIKREDGHQIVSGKAYFIHDLQFPGMLHARILRPKNYQSVLESLDENAAKAAVPGIVKIVRNGNFLGVITQSEYQAEQAIKALDKHSRWTQPAIFPEQSQLAQHIKQIAEAPKRVHDKGQVDSQSDSKTHKSAYFKPYTMHGSMGPACGIALYDGKVLHVWSHSQGVYPLREALKSMLELTDEQVHVISSPGAGCFGHTVADDAAADAALLAMTHPGHHIKVQWSRHDEHRWEPYGSAMIMELEGSLDESGNINSLIADIWTDSHSTRPNRDAGTLLAARYIEPPMPMQGRGYLGGGHRNGDAYYDIANLKVNAHFFEGPLRVSSVRSLGAYANIFALESFMDEMAEKAGKDPIGFRLAHQKDERAVAVIKKVRDMTKDVSTATNEGIGYAFCRYKNNDAYCAMAAKVLVDGDSGDVKILKMWAAVDVGEVINAEGIRIQTEGCMLQAASWTMREAVTFDEKQITSIDWQTYPIFRMVDAPEMEVEIIDRPDQPVTGGGEAGIPPVGAAIANAIYQASGQRVRTLPVKLDGQSG